VYTGDPRLETSTPVREVLDAAELAGIGIAASGTDVGTGGMESKLTSATTATGAGIPVLLASAADAVAALAVSPAGNDGIGPTVGTAFAPATRRTSARLFWLRHAASSSGSLSLDHGAVAAVTQRRKSLLPAGITGYTAISNPVTWWICWHPTARSSPAVSSATTPPNCPGSSAAHCPNSPLTCAIPSCTPTI